MILKLILIPLISALIGYITNVVAVKMLFWPREPVNLFFFQLYGVLPKRRAQVATSLGQLVEEQLLSIDDLFDKINTPDMREKIIDHIVILLRDRLYAMLPRIIQTRVVQVISDTLEKILRLEAENMVHQIIRYGQDYLTREVQVSKIVEDKVNAFDLKQLEDMIWGVSSPELRFIEILGGIMGLLIGFVQVAIMLIFR